METPTTEYNHPWLKNPLKSEIGKLLLAGQLVDSPGISPNNMRILGNYALIFIDSGKAYFQDRNGIERELVPGDTILIFPEIAHSYGPQPGSSWTQIYVVFEGPGFDFLRESSILNPTEPVWHLEPVDNWRRRLEEIFKSRSPHGDSSALRTVGRFVSLLTDMLATVREAGRSHSDVWLEESMHLLSEPREQGWLTPQETATRVGLSYENFRKLFAKLTSESPAQYQKRRRIEHACAAIYQNAASFKQLADELGFCDVYHFSKVFSQIMGESPSSFRKKVSGG